MRRWTNPPTWRKTSRLRWPPDSGPNQTNQALISRAKASGSRPARLRPGFPVTAGRPGNARPCLRRRCRPPPAAQTDQSHRRFCAGSNGILRLNRSLVSWMSCISPWAFQGDHAKLSKLDSAAMIASWDSTWYWGHLHHRIKNFARRNCLAIHARPRGHNERGRSGRRRRQRCGSKEQLQQNSWLRGKTHACKCLLTGCIRH